MTKTEKRKIYSEPKIERIVLDNEISLALESNNGLPPIFPGEESARNTPNTVLQDPFKTSLS